MRLTMRANEGIALPGPSHGGANDVVKLQVLEPDVALVSELAVGDLDGELVGPAEGHGVGAAVGAAEPLLGDGAVPDVVEVEVAAVEADVDAVAAAGDVLVVQGLVQVGDEVDDELGGLGAQPVRQVRVERLGGVVSQGADDAAVGLAVAVEVDVAVVRRAVVGVDEVEVLGEAAPARVADGVGPAGDARQVVGLVAPEQLLEVRLGGVGDEVAGDVGGGDVSEA